MKVHCLEAVGEILFFACFCFRRGFFPGGFREGCSFPYPGFNCELRVTASQKDLL